MWGHVYNLKKQFKVQVISILEEIDSFYKNPLMKRIQKNLGRAFPAPSFGQNPKEQQFFLVRLSPRNMSIIGCVKDILGNISELMHLFRKMRALVLS